MRVHIKRGVILTVCGLIFFYLPFGPFDGHMDEPQIALPYALLLLPACVVLPYGLWLTTRGVIDAVAQRKHESGDPGNSN